jgi:hypothetical protein
MAMRSHLLREEPMERKPPQRDSDIHKGAIEDERHETNTSLRGQLDHRSSDSMIKNSDSDFPEPGGNPEHTGEPQDESADSDPQGQESGHLQKQNQNWRKEDPLAS